MHRAKIYQFDEKLHTLNIKLIDRKKVSIEYSQIICDRCSATLQYVNVLRIKKDHYNIGNNCYDSIKIILSKIRNISLHLLREQLESNYFKYLKNKYCKAKVSPQKSKDKRYHQAFNRYLAMKYDEDHEGLPSFRKREFNELKAFFQSKK